MKRSVIGIIKIFATAFLYTLFLAPVSSFGTPQASFNVLHKNNLADFAQVSAKELRKQENSLFKVPDFLRPAVNFWIDIYAKHNSNKIVLHDKRYLQIVYKVIDISDIYNKNISYRSKKRLRRKRIEKNRKAISLALRNLARKKINPSRLIGLEKKIYDLFSGIKEKNKFKKAVKRVRAQIGHRDRFRLGLEDSGLFIRKMEHIFSSYDLPIELTRLPFVESFFNPKAFSKRGASGVWQFMRSTGLLFLKINHIIDERNDPFKSTHAAAKLLKGNYKTLGSWPLAVTAYNHGRLGVKRAVEAVGSDNLGDIIKNYRRRRFGFASRNFYAEFLAAADVYRNHSRYFKDIHFKNPVRFDTFKLPDYVSMRSLAKHCDISPEVMRGYNPELTVSVLSSHLYLTRGYVLKIPKGVKNKFARNYEKMPGRLKMTVQKGFDRHRVTRGQTLSQIARIYRVRVADVVALNNLSSRNFIRAGRILKLPQPVSKSSRISSVSKSSRKPIKKVQASSKPSGKKSAKATTQRVQAKPKKVLAKKSSSEQIHQPMLLSAKEKNNSVSSGTMIINKGLGNPKMISFFSRRSPAVVSSSPPAEAKNLLIDRHDKPIVKVIDHPETDNTVIVQPHETWGHYAEWLETNARRLRRLNGFRYGRPINVGMKIKIELRKVNRGSFEARRHEYHLNRQNLYLSLHTVDRIEKHVLKKRQNIWTLCQRVYKIPLWLLKKYNSDKDLAKLIAGDALRIPIVVRND